MRLTEAGSGCFRRALHHENGFFCKRIKIHFSERGKNSIETVSEQFSFNGNLLQRTKHNKLGQCLCDKRCCDHEQQHQEQRKLVLAAHMFERFGCFIVPNVS